MPLLIIRYGENVSTGLLGAIDHLSRASLEALIERAIDRLDGCDGDPDAEENGDEQDSTWAEDDAISMAGRGAGCSVADPG